MFNLYSLTHFANTGFAMMPSGGQGGSGGLGMMGSFVPLFLMILIFYFLLMRPQQKREKERKELIASIKEGDRVLTMSGIYGTVSALRDDVVILRIAKGTEVEFARSSIHTKLS